MALKSILIKNSLRLVLMDDKFTEIENGDIYIEGPE